MVLIAGCYQLLCLLLTPIATASLLVFSETHCLDLLQGFAQMQLALCSLSNVIKLYGISRSSETCPYPDSHISRLHVLTGQ